MNFLPQVIGGSESEEEKEEIIDIIDNKLNEEDVFDNKPVEKLQMKVVKEEPVVKKEPVVEPEPEPIQEVISEPIETPKPVKKPRKKRVLTEAQKEKLAQARVKALEVRRANARKKQEIKDLKKQKQDQELNELRSHVKPIQKKEEPKKEEPKKEENIKMEIQEVKEVKEKKAMFSQEDVDMITFKAISNYDEIRKQRKKDKLKKKEEDSIKERERQKLLRIIKPYDASTDPFAGCY
jgi:translation initiation factor IF-2